MAFESQGTEFFWSTVTTVASTSTSCRVGEITDFSGPGGQAAVIDVTNLNSTAKEKLVGLRDEGQLSLSLNLSFSDTAQTAIRTDRANRTKRKCVIKFNDSTDDLVKTKAVFDAYCLGFSVSGAVDQAAKANAVIEITGAVTYTQSTVIPQA
jgi:hypothetical protein